MDALVKNFRGISEALITISPIALLAGTNGAGKTSMAKAIAAASTGRAVPYDKITKKDCAIMMRKGTHSGKVMLGDEQNMTEVEWPSADVKSIGDPPRASEIAAGLTDLFVMKEDKALAYLIDMLKASPSLEDLKIEFEASGINLKIADQVWKVIEAQGWQAAHKRAVETGQQKKGAWAQITGESYGSKKAEEWHPEGLEDSMLEQTSDDLQKSISKANSELEAAIGKSAINKSETEKLKELAGKIGEYQEKIDAFAKEKEELKEQIDKVDEELRNTPNIQGKEPLLCPHCKGAVHITAVHDGIAMLTKAEKVDMKSAKEASLKHAGLCGERSKLKGLETNCISALDTSVRLHTHATTAKEKLEEMSNAPVEDTSAEVLKLRSMIASLQHQQSIVIKYKEAHKVAEQIITNQKLVATLDETGLRKKKLGECLDAFTSHYIEPICNDFSIPLVSIDGDLQVTMGATSYPMLSASEQFRVKCVLQLAIAKFEKSDIVIIDGADILDGKGRSALLKAVYNVEIPAVICMTLNKPDQAPDLAKMNAGISYWLQNGTCKQIGEEKKAA